MPSSYVLPDNIIAFAGSELIDKGFPSQPGGASVTMRKLVEAARKEYAEADRLREARESINRFALAMAGDAPGFEEATRALYGNERERFDSLVQAWPPDVRDHVLELAASAFADESATGS